MKTAVRPLPRPRASAGSPGFAALLSGLFPGLGQLYQGRWVRGVLMLLLPAFSLTLLATFVAIADPLTAIVITHAALAALLVIGGLFAFHIVIVGDAFAGRLAESGLRGRHAVDYVILGLITIALMAAYGTVYRQSAAWASVFNRVFDPVARAAGLPVLPNEPQAPQWSGRERLTVLVLGIDSRGENSETQNTDTVLVLSMDPINKTASMLSIPRDTFVTIPGYGSEKINAAYSLAGPDKGPELARRTVEDLLGIPIHAYALIDFEAFRGLIDSVGGVLVDVRRPLRDEEYPTNDFGVERIEILAGPQLMGGEQALRYARSRHDSNDFSRARRQQLVVTAFRARLGEVGLGRLPGIFDRVGTTVKTSFDPANLLPLAATGIAIATDSIRSEVLMPCNAPDAAHCELKERNDPGGYYLFPDRPKIADLVAELFYDPRVRQEGARVEIRSTGARNGTAQEVADRLEARAFGIARVSTGPAARSAVVLRTRGKRYTADQLAKQLGLQVVSPEAADPAADPQDVDIVVRIGSDFRGLASDLQK
ncbi:MAG: LCP family protein [Candidatus Rokubacteria bacterium]|nr:LCP family protein [Candidatus Rokubacteria bacterium]